MRTVGAGRAFGRICEGAKENSEGDTYEGTRALKRGHEQKGMRKALACQGGFEAGTVSTTRHSFHHSSNYTEGPQSLDSTPWTHRACLATPLPPPLLPVLAALARPCGCPSASPPGAPTPRLPPVDPCA